MKILVCGGREYKDRDYMFKYLDNLLETWDDFILVSGMARGADRLSVKWAEQNNITVEPYPANWDKHGKAAGPIRNRQMLKEAKPDIVVAFPGGDGTNDMVEIATKTKNVKVIQAVIKRLWE